MTQDKWVDEPSENATRTSPWFILISPRVSTVFYLFFLALLIRLERAVIDTIAGPGAYPIGFAWQLLWPTGLIALALFLPYYVRWFFLGITGSLSILILGGDAVYFDFFGTVTSAYILTSMHQLIDVGDSVLSITTSARVLPILLLMPCFFLGVISLRHRSLAAARPPNNKWLRPVHAVAVGLVLVNLLFGFIASRTPIYEETHHLNRRKWVLPQEHWLSRYSRSSYAATFGIFNYHVMDLIGMIRDQFQKPILTTARKAEIETILTHKKLLNDQKSPLWGAARGRHVIIIQLESLQHFLLDLKVQGHEVMPVLNHLKKSSLNWDLIFDVTLIGRTSDAEFATMTGMLPDTRRPAAYYSLPDSLVTLPKELKKHGYATASIHGFKRSFWNRAVTHPAYGIDSLHFEERFQGMPKIGLGVADEFLFRYSADLLQSHKEQRQLLFVISLSSHHPYIYIDESYLDPYVHLRPDDGYGLLPFYLASASYTDEALGIFLQLLEDRGLLQDSLLVIYGDHDRGLLQAEKPIPEVGERMNTITEDRIPMVISIPGKEKLIAQHAQSFAGIMGGLQDLAPTILHLLGEEIPKGMMGTHLFVGNAHRDAIPIPTVVGLFAYRGLLSVPQGRIVTTPFVETPLDQLPSEEEALRDQLAVQEIMDHYEEIMGLE